MSKIPKIKNNIDIQKIPKAQQGSNYKKMYPAWRIGKLDLEGIWGYYTYCDKFTFEVNDDLLDFLTDNNYDDLLNVLMTYEGSEYKSLKALFRDLNNIKGVSFAFLEHLSNSIRKTYFIKKIYPKLKEYEKNTWDEIEKMTYGRENKTKNHYIAVSSLAKQAQSRLKELQIDDIDSLFSLRLEGKLRIFGIREFNYLNILWVDSEHEVCPIQK